MSSAPRQSPAAEHTRTQAPCRYRSASPILQVDGRPERHGVARTISIAMRSFGRRPARTSSRFFLPLR